jgi:hypothetical protein
MDWVTKTLLTALTLGLWANLIMTWAVPRTARASDTANIWSVVATIEAHVRTIVDGTCKNQKLCG